MKMARRTLAAGALALIVASVAQAQPEACKADIEKFCAEVEHGQGRVLKCLTEHTSDLSAQCKTFLETRRQGRRDQHAARRKERPRSEMRRACKSDIEKFCKEAMGKPDQMAECLREHQVEFTAECREKVEQVLKRVDESKKTGEKKG
jgi:Golgi apparatus protein 1